MDDLSSWQHTLICILCPSQLLEIFVSGKLLDFKEFQTENPAIFDSLGESLAFNLVFKIGMWVGGRLRKPFQRGWTMNITIIHAKCYHTNISHRTGVSKVLA